MSEIATLLTPPHNYAVVQLPERNFPGVVIQGDSLSNLVSLLRTARSETNEEERMALLGEVLEMLEGGLEIYKTACAEAGMALPFVEQK